MAETIFQITEQPRTILRMAQSKLHAGENESCRVAKVVADAVADYDTDGVPLGEE